jgi:hypothetical protein
MVHRSLIAMLSLVVAMNPVAAQDVAIPLLVGYIGLTVNAIHSVATRGSPPKVHAGTTLKVRLHGSADWSAPGRVTRVTPDSMMVANDSVTLSFARSELDSLQVKASKGRWAEGWVIGFVAGGAYGAIAGHATANENQDDLAFTPNQAAVIGGIGFGVIGSVVGMGIGLLAPSRWVTIGDPKNARVSLAPTFARPGFVARIRF